MSEVEPTNDAAMKTLRCHADVNNKYMMANMTVGDLRSLLARLDAAEAKLDKLPKTADGVVIERGMELFKSYWPTGEVLSIGPVFCLTVGMNYSQHDNPEWYVMGFMQHRALECYSTREAAEAAEAALLEKESSR